MARFQCHPFVQYLYILRAAWLYCQFFGTLDCIASESRRRHLAQQYWVFLKRYRNRGRLFVNLLACRLADRAAHRRPSWWKTYRHFRAQTRSYPLPLGGSRIDYIAYTYTTRVGPRPG